jgi:hypothetical protein
MAERHVPHEVKEASRKVDQFIGGQAKELERIKGDSEESMTRAQAAVALRVDGASYSEIARLLEYSSAQRARGAIEKALAEQMGSPEEVEHVRWLNGRRLERILSSLMKRATNPKDPDHLQYARMAVIVIDRHARLYGADAPQKVDVQYTPARAEIEAWALELAQHVRGKDAEEADLVLEMEVVDG